MKTAEGFIKQMGYPANTQVYSQAPLKPCTYASLSTYLFFDQLFTQIQVLPEGGETPIFKQFFKGWKEKDQAEGLGRVYVTERIAKIQQVQFDASKLHESHQMAAQYNMVDNGSGKTEVTIYIQKISDCRS